MAKQKVHSTQSFERKTVTNPFLRSLMVKYYKPIVKREVKLANASPSDKILCIGGGYFPCTAVLFHKLTKATITVIDNDKDAVDGAVKLMEKLKLQNGVIVKHTDGVDINPQDYDYVHIAMQISPKEEVFNKIYSSMAKGGKVMVRVPKKRVKNAYQPFEVDVEHNSSAKAPRYSYIDRTLIYEV